MSLAENIAPRDLYAHYRAVKARLNRGRQIKNIPISYSAISIPIPIARIAPINMQEPEAVARPRYPSISRIIEAVSEYYGIALVDILGRRHHKELVTARHVAAYLARIMTLKSLPEIGRAMDDRDHTTILSAVRKMEKRLMADEDLAGDVAYLHSAIRSALEAA